LEVANYGDKCILLNSLSCYRIISGIEIIIILAVISIIMLLAFNIINWCNFQTNNLCLNISNLVRQI